MASSIYAPRLDRVAPAREYATRSGAQALRRWVAQSDLLARSLDAY
jgi:hypothetical protein